jgi:hypothetical protein
VRALNIAADEFVVRKRMERESDAARLLPEMKRRLIQSVFYLNRRRFRYQTVGIMFMPGADSGISLIFGDLRAKEIPGSRAQYLHEAE